MGRPKQTLKVVPNPYGAIDHNGQPCCAVMCHQGEHVPRGTIRYVGANIVDAAIVRPAVEVSIGGVVHQTQPADHEIVWEFSAEPVDVPNIPYYVEHITRNADLIAADVTTAKLCGISQFVEPSKLLAQSKEAARAEWDAQHGEGDFAKAEQWRAEQKAIRLAAEADAKPKTQKTSEPSKGTK